MNSRRPAPIRTVIGALALLGVGVLVPGCGNDAPTPPQSVATSLPAALHVAVAKGAEWNQEQVVNAEAERKAEAAATTQATNDPLPDFGPKAVKLPDGLVYVDDKVGTGPKVKEGDTIVVDYVGTFPDGKQFDASSAHGGPSTFALERGKLIEGWLVGIAGMQVGGVRRLGVPPALGYGAQRSGPVPPQSNLVFKVTLHEIKPKP